MMGSWAREGAKNGNLKTEPFGIVFVDLDPVKEKLNSLVLKRALVGASFLKAWARRLAQRSPPAIACQAVYCKWFWRCSRLLCLGPTPPVENPPPTSESLPSLLRY
ncbi:hypothetical protein [Ralstonia pseudosolanacearum]